MAKRNYAQDATLALRATRAKSGAIAFNSFDLSSFVGKENSKETRNAIQIRVEELYMEAENVILWGVARP